MTDENIENKRTYLRIKHDKSYELIDLTNDEADELMNDIRYKPNMGALLRITGVKPHPNIVTLSDDILDEDVPCFRSKDLQ